ncbi:MAG: hypothetical protein CSA31_00750 [Desulfobulbus propionicus]|nr:MAG: hypothetical protein CSA31_00750 [Desulfobulbus propionicus]
MTTILKNSSELAKAAALLKELLLPLPESLQYEVFHNFTLPDHHNLADKDISLFNEEQPLQETPQKQLPQRKEMVSSPITFTKDEEGTESTFTSDKLEKLLENLCRQSGFQSAVVADEKGLPLGGINTPASIDILAALSAMLGGVLDRVPHFLDQYESGNISLDINYVDKVVVQKFPIDEEHFYLLIICSQDIDERAYIELFSEQISKILQNTLSTGLHQSGL